MVTGTVEEELDFLDFYFFLGCCFSGLGHDIYALLFVLVLFRHRPSLLGRIRRSRHKNCFYLELGKNLHSYTILCHLELRRV